MIENCVGQLVKLNNSGATANNMFNYFVYLINEQLLLTAIQSIWEPQPT